MNNSRRTDCKAEHLFRTACLTLLALTTLGITTGIRAEIVQATYSISASNFEDSNGNPPTPPTSNLVDGVYMFTFDASQAAQNEIVPDEVQGLDITRSTGIVNDFDTTNSGVNTSLNTSTGSGRITIGGTESSVAFMVGLSNDFRVEFDISLSDYEVTQIVEDLKFVTRSDPFYTSIQTSVTLLDVSVLADTDGDGVFDNNDNCTLVQNAAQRDTNGDGIGNICDADLNDDCAVNFGDLAVIKSVFFPLPYNPDADFDGDGFVNFGDLATMKATFFNGVDPGPGPSGLPTECGS